MPLWLAMTIAASCLLIGCLVGFAAGKGYEQGGGFVDPRIEEEHQKRRAIADAYVRGVEERIANREGDSL